MSVSTATTPAIFEAVERLQFNGARQALLTDRSTAWPSHVLNEVELEFRRYLILRLLFNRDQGAPGMVGLFSDVAVVADRGQLEHLGLATSGRVHEQSDAGAESDLDWSSAYQEVFERALPEAWTSTDEARFVGVVQPSVVGK